MEEKLDTSALRHKSKKTPFFKKYRLTPKQKKIWLSILSILLLISIIAGLVGYGYNRGYANGKKAGKNNAASTNPMSNIENPFKSLTGTVIESKDNKLTIEPTRGDKKTVTLNDKTKITKKTSVLAPKDVTKGQKVTVFTSGDDNNLVATRIVIRE